MNADKFAIIHKGTIQAICEAIPSHELADNQIPLTDKEYRLLYAVGADFELAKKLIESIESKIKQ